MGEHFPTPWRVEPYSFSIYADNVPKGPARVADMRGWGYLTGKGHGALALSDDKGVAIQKANAEFIVKAVNSHEALVKALHDIIAANNEFRKGMPDGWEGDPLQDACHEAAKLLLPLK